MDGCRYESNCPLVVHGTIGGVTSVGVFLRDPSLICKKLNRPVLKTLIPNCPDRNWKKKLTGPGPRRNFVFCILFQVETRLKKFCILFRAEPGRL